MFRKTFAAWSGAAATEAAAAAAAASAAASTASSEAAAATSSDAASSSTAAASSSSSTAPKWTFNEIIKTNEASGEVSTTILKFDHPYRMQRVMVVPVPRFATEQFYKDWCYQPYVKDHQLRVSNDIFNPAFVAIPRLVLQADKAGFYQGLKYFTPLYMPDAIDNNVSRRVFISREQNFNTFTPFMMLTTNNFREKWHPWIARKTKKLVGERYLSHPKEDKQSFVVLVCPHYAATMANTLQGLGFRVADSVEVPTGSAKPLKRLHFWGDFCLFAVLSYFWIVISVMIVNESLRFWAALRKYQAHLILLGGKDPYEYGYTEEEVEAAHEQMRAQ